MDWYRSFSDGVFKYIAGMVKDVYEAEDLTQDTFIKVHLYLVAHEEITHPKAFLYRTAHNLAVDHIRKQAPIRLIRDFFGTGSDPRATPESILDVKEDAKELWRALHRLKPSYREMIVLRKVEEFSTRETAEILDCSESKVKTTLLRALRALKKELIKERRGS